MFDISFGELAVIGVVALVVIGPEKLPKVARTVGALVGRAQRYVHDVKADIQREVNLGELKQLHSEVHDAAQSLRHSVQSQLDDARQAVSEVQTQLNEVSQTATQTLAEARDALDTTSQHAADTVHDVPNTATAMPPEAAATQTATTTVPAVAADTATPLSSSSKPT